LVPAPPPARHIAAGAACRLARQLRPIRRPLAIGPRSNRRAGRSRLGAAVTAARPWSARV